MSNSRIILQAVGDQDKYLTIGAKSTLFKNKHRRHTLFGKDRISSIQIIKTVLISHHQWF